MTARDYLTLLRESWWLVGAVVAAGLLIAALVTVLTPPSYASTATFYVSTPGAADDTTSSYQGAQLAQERVASYSELITGQRVAIDASTALGGTPSPDDVQDAITTDFTEDTVVLSMTVTASSPAEATRIANAVSGVFLRLVTGLESPRGATGQAPRVTTDVVLPPTFSPEAVAPSLLINLTIGGLVGLALGLGAAVVRRTLDVSVSTSEQVEEIVDAAVLGTVPLDPSSGDRPVALLGGGTEPDDRTWLRAEAYRRIRTNVEFVDVDGVHRVVVVTSTAAGDGKTSLVLNLAAALAATDRRVVIVDADLRRPQVAARLSLETAVGFTTVVTGRVDLDAAIQRWSEGGVDVLGAGALPPRPNELLASRKAGAVLTELRSRYDTVLVDSPPLGPVTDAANLGAHADGAIVVARAGVTTRQELADATADLRRGGITVIGAVLTGVRPTASSRRVYYGPSAPTPDRAAVPATVTGPRPTPSPRATTDVSSSSPVGSRPPTVSMGVRYVPLPTTAELDLGPVGGKGRVDEDRDPVDSEATGREEGIVGQGEDDGRQESDSQAESDSERDEPGDGALTPAGLQEHPERSVDQSRDGT